MGWRRQQAESGKGSGRRQRKHGRGVYGVQEHQPSAATHSGQSATFWQKIGSYEHEVDASGYTGRSRPAQ